MYINLSDSAGSVFLDRSIRFRLLSIYLSIYIPTLQDKRQYEVHHPRPDADGYSLPSGDGRELHAGSAVLWSHSS